MGTISHKTKAFISLDPNLLNHSRTKRMKVAMEIELGDLQTKKTNSKKHCGENSEKRNSYHSLLPLLRKYVVILRRWKTVKKSNSKLSPKVSLYNFYNHGRPKIICVCAMYVCKCKCSWTKQRADMVTCLRSKIAHINSGILRVVLRSVIICRLFAIFCTIKITKISLSYA